MFLKGSSDFFLEHVQQSFLFLIYFNFDMYTKNLAGLFGGLGAFDSKPAGDSGGGLFGGFGGGASTGASILYNNFH